MPSPALITPRPVYAFPNKLADNAPINIGQNPPFCSFASFLIVSLTPFISKPDFSRDLTIFIISSISLFEITNDVVLDPKMFFCIVPSVSAVAVNPNGIKKHLVHV